MRACSTVTSCNQLLTAVPLSDGNLPTPRVVQGLPDVVAALLQCHAGVNCTRRDGCTPVMLAARFGHHHVVQQLVEAKADGETWTSFAEVAVAAPPLDAVSALTPAFLTRFKVTSAFCMYYMTQFSMCGRGVLCRVVAACLRGDDHLCAVLVESKNGWSPLLYACRGGSKDCVALLLEAGADANHHR